MRFFFSTVGLHNPALAMELPEHMGFPIANECAGGLDLDYSALLLGQQFVIDTTAYELIVSGCRPFLGPMATSLQRLRESELLALVDMGTIIRENRDRILAKVDTLLEVPSIWLDDVRRQWRRVAGEFEAFDKKYGTSGRSDHNRGHFGIENWLAERGTADDDQLRRSALALLQARRKTLNGVETDQLRGLLRFIMTQVVSTDLMRHSIGAPVLNWDDAQPYYDRLYATRWDTDTQEAKICSQARVLFDCVIPELKPGSIEQVIRFVRDDKAVKSMRSELFQRIEEGVPVSKDWFATYMNEVFRKELARQRWSRRMRWLGSAMGILLPGASLAQEIANEAGIEAAEEIANKWRGRKSAKYHWYYALQRISDEKRAFGVRQGTDKDSPAPSM